MSFCVYIQVWLMYVYRPFHIYRLLDTYCTSFDKYLFNYFFGTLLYRPLIHCLILTKVLMTFFFFFFVRCCKVIIDRLIFVYRSPRLIWEWWLIYSCFRWEIALVWVRLAWYYEYAHIFSSQLTYWTARWCGKLFFLCLPYPFFDVLTWVMLRFERFHIYPLKYMYT